jgi:uncharacterized protein
MRELSVEQARGYYEAADPAHDFEHVLRVLRLAERIAATEGADVTVVRAAALLHDIGRAEEIATGADHAAVAAERARPILAAAGYSPAQVAAAAQAIAAHRFRQGTPPATLEARVLYDADKLDAIGAIGVARAYAIAGVCGQRLWADVAPDYLANKLAAGPHAAHDLTAAHTPVHEMVFKLARLKDTLSTPTARAIAEERHRFMLEFFARLEQEVKGEL